MMGLFRRKRREPPASQPAVGDGRSELDRLTAKFQAEAERDASRLSAKLDAEHPSPPPPAQPEAASARPPAHGALAGPSWMPSSEWADRLDAYHRQGRTDADIRRVAEHLEARGPRTPWTREQKIDRAKCWSVSGHSMST